MKPEPTSVDDYIASFPAEVQHMLSDLRTLIKRLAPEATEKISYKMPTYYLNGNLVHFAAYARHIGFYPTPSAISAFQDELAGYKHAKGSVQFPLDEPLPVDLITRIVEYRVQENRAKKKG
jgi:uncharacterized protein YdhG (YjbR/CyaY superfamily)